MMLAFLIATPTTVCVSCWAMSEAFAFWGNRTWDGCHAVKPFPALRSPNSKLDYRWRVLAWNALWSSTFAHDPLKLEERWHYISTR
jgi:hypothetical protein